MLAVEVIKYYEQLHDDDLTLIGLQPKRCPAGVWTSGYGRALIHPETGKFLKGIADKKLAYKIGTVTEAEAEENLAEDVKTFSQAVEGVLTTFNITTTDYQFAALVSFAYNCGIGALANTKTRFPKKVLQAIMTGEPSTITKAFMLWNKSKGKVLRGLTARRRTEAHLFNTGKLVFFKE